MNALLAFIFCVAIMTPTEIRPQPGPQEEFLSCAADIAIIGGGAWGGKTFALILEPTFHTSNPNFGAVFFRRTSNEITNNGGLWDEAQGIYKYFGAEFLKSAPLQARFPSGAKVSFHHLHDDATVQNWKSAQIPLILFDQLEMFTAHQFWYMLSRNRSSCGVRPYIRASCNPDPDSFVADLVAWYIDPDTGYAVPERSGVIRWFIRIGDDLRWFDTKAEADAAAAPLKVMPMSFTFIRSSAYDNVIGQKVDPTYIGKLQALTEVERERLLMGNWKIRRVKGNFYKDSWLVGDGRVINHVPVGSVQKWVRYWDLASSDTTKSDYTVGCLMGVTAELQYIIADVERMRVTPGDRDARARQTLERDAAMLQQLGGQMRYYVEVVQGLGGESVRAFIKMLNAHADSLGSNITVRPDYVNKSKTDRAEPLALAAELGRTRIVRDNEDRRWVGTFVNELVSFPSKDVHDDQVDAASGAYNKLRKASGGGATPRRA